MRFTVNQTVGCTPFPKSGIQSAKTAAGISFLANTVVLVPLTVLVGNEQVKTGDTVYVSGKDYVQGWAKNPYEADGVTMIFVPVGSILFVERPIAPKPEPTSLPSNCRES